MLKKIFIISLLSLSLCLPLIILAEEEAGTELELDYPVINGYRPTTTNVPLPDILKYIFNLGIGISGLIIFGSLIYAGVKYQTSQGSPGKQREAKDRVFSAVTGIAILFSSYLILTTINPELVFVSIERIENPVIPERREGVYLKDDQDEEHVFLGSSNNLTSLSGKIKSLEIENPSDRDYTFGAILHEETENNGTCKIYINDASDAEILSGASSMTVFRKLKSNFGSLYGSVKIFDAPQVTKEAGYFEEIHPACMEQPCWQSLSPTLKENVWAIEITGPYMAILANDDQSKCYAFTGSVPDLKSYSINRCKADCIWGIFFCRFSSCVTKIAVVPLYESSSAQ